MKYLTYRIIISLPCVLLILSHFVTIERAYGKDNTIRPSRLASQDPFLKPENTGEVSGHISEADILFTIDEAGKAPDEDVVQTTASRKIKEIDKSKKNKSILSYKLVSEYLEKGKKFEARNELSDLYFRETDNERRSEIKNKLDELNEVLVFSRTPTPDAVNYEVKPGDSLVKIANKFDTSYAFIMRINKKPRTLIKIGERLKILKGELSLLVDKSDYTLTILLDGHFIKQYPIGIGKSDKTPVGEFVVDNKLINPTWYSPDGVYKYGHPENVLGTRWIGFEDKDDLYGYGIHGTVDPDSIGKDMSNGCIRMKNKNVEELFDFVKAKTRVVMQE
ncbi:MAG: L,D-transpeptidase family protein [Candidatus Scalindua sp.]|jgi:lipoprotein-anchoring transpeptidase ErfK/SrfK|nr:L,D-transpeptidase family protein [Candidatus Scalindua sp.]